MVARTFAETLKEARLKAGLSQSALARQAGLTGSYLSLLESRRRPPPTPKVIRALCKALGIDDDALQEAAALERSPAPVRKRLERMRRERGRVQKTRDRLLTTTLFHLAHRPRVVEPMREFLDLPVGQQALLGRLLGRVRRVRDVDEAASNSDDLLQDATPADRDGLLRVIPRALDPGGSPPRVEPVGAPLLPVHAHLDRRGAPLFEEPVPARLFEDGRFYWRVHGDEAHPRVEDGDLALVAPASEPADGDLVAFTHEGRDRLALYVRRGDEVHLAFPRPEIPPLRLPAALFTPAGVVVRVVRDSR